MDGAYARPLGPQHFADGYFGYGLVGMVEKVLSPKYSLGLSFSQYTILNNDGDRWNLSVLDVVGRRWFAPWHAFNPYVLLGVGGDLFRDSYKQPFGDVFHVQVALGSQYVFDSHWALDYALDYHVLAPLNTAYHFPGARIGLSYRYGTQPKVNQIAPPPLEVNGVEELSQARIESIMGGLHYTVKPGDTLYGITGKPEARLGNPNLWPLVAAANAKTVKDPQLIMPGQVIQVRHNYTNEEKLEALRKASDIPYSRPTAQKP
jgi:hypothetical protein